MSGNRPTPVGANLISSWMFIASEMDAKSQPLPLPASICLLPSPPKRKGVPSVAKGYGFRFPAAASSKCCTLRYSLDDYGIGKD